MKRKFLILTLIIFIILLLFFITLMKQEKRESECKIDDDCPQALCGAECGYVCKSGSCVFVKCEDHGKLNGFECICNEGWTGYHCERKISE